ncbi:MAG: diguanylate cyclase [Planctomycetes bacterium]|nr:diguanylate cyclase [Planctomycetota bacterium]
MGSLGAEHWGFLAVVVLILLAQVGAVKLAHLAFGLGAAGIVVAGAFSTERGWAAAALVSLVMVGYVLYTSWAMTRMAGKKEEEEEKEAKRRLEDAREKRDLVAREMEMVDAELEANHRLYQMSRDLGGVITMNEFHREVAKLVKELARPKQALLVYMDLEKGAPHLFLAYDLAEPGRDVKDKIGPEHPLWEHFRDPTATGILSHLESAAGQEVVIFLSHRGRVVGGVYLLDVAPPKTLAMDVKSLIYTLAVQVNMAGNKCMLYLEIERMSRNDVLTGVYKRWYFLDLLEEEFERSAVQNKPLTVLMIDIDHFKDFNDTYGHLAGDKVLSTVASYLKEHVRIQDILCRYGGEEFCVVLPDTPPEGAMIVAERLRVAIAERPIQIAGMVTTITISVGGATYPDDESGLEELLERSDTEMYRSKTAGRNKVAFPSMREPIGPGLASDE